MMDSFEKRFDEVLERIEKARVETNEYQIVKIVAVSKYVTSNEIKALYSVGQRAFGENRVQELKQKSEELSDLPIEWHFQGVLQKNKINSLLSLNPSLIQSIDSFELAHEVNKRAEQNINVLLQINSSGAATQSGVEPQSAVETYLKIKEQCANLNLRGVMSIGAHSEDEKEIVKSFETTFKIFESLQKEGAKICSMGMSGDFELAIKCGSNMVRLGSILFK